ncbi:outer membrane beta-barrel protein [Xanthobacter sp. V4C-4]|uniref:outer membrane protein n=1 Tax=Xanthobacter cornucopiae TaxID=3119924 RepID=UPI00372AB211
MRKTLLLNTFAVALAAGPAYAADLSVTKATPAAPPAWTGFYAGVNVGFGWGTSGSADTLGLPLVDNIAGDPLWGTPAGFTAAANSGTASLGQSGMIGGAQAGYNYQWGASVVLGIEADLQGSAIRGTGGYAGIAQYGPDLSGLVDTAAGAGTVTAGIDWFGTVRARLGYLVTPDVLLYATGGLAYGGVTARSINTVSFADDLPGYFPTFGGSGAASSTRVGWTIGGGAEWLVTPGWSVKAEALYYNLGSSSFASSPVGATDPDGANLAGGVPGAVLFANTPVTTVSYDGFILRAGVNYHFNAGPAATSAAEAAPAGWNGLYAGLNAGYGWGTSGTADTLAFPVADAIATDPYWGTPAGFTALANSGAASLSPSGFIGGVQVGYNYQWGPSVVAGIEADIQGSGITGTGSYAGIAQYGPDLSGLIDTATGAGTVTASVDWLGTVRARVGYLATPALLLYATGGLAYGGVTADSANSVAFHDDIPASYPTVAGTGHLSQTRVGWTLGGGGEWQLASRWSVKAEALYYNLGSSSFASTAVGAIDPDGNNLAGGVPGATLFANVPTTTVTYDGVIVRAGINYRFN